ncbi:hypothetical protein EOPP23_03370 [Endozoicomonas sp. OPT23]|uniref:aminoacyl-tRNA deacylase n=1 Tax=Endozoicomonas sp. OPT23 TaxID=2072845 RepID=UPI00129BA8C6|nr:YbaK/EbsC family protein [Endozoicomonas sp. OPT23]MRI32039.1 hypothetical protein [Endozoicomonas sp. OPT23]
MTIARKLHRFLNDHHAEYELVSHPYSERAVDTAHSACIPVKNMTKAVVLHDNKGYVMAIMPSMNKLMLRWLNTKLDRHLNLATEPEINRLFPDCEQGAVPPMGMAYGINTCWDDELNSVKDLYLEAGDHRELIHLNREQFKELFQGQSHAAISCDPEEEKAYRNVL